MKSIIAVFALILLAASLGQSAPINSNNNSDEVIYSGVDISGEPVRQKRGYSEAAGDYYICYPSSFVYEYYNHPNALEQSNRRSSDAVRRVSAVDSFDARKDRADRERAAYTDSFGK